MDLHPYDGKARRFRHDDADPSIGRSLAAGLLRLTVADLPAATQFDLEYFSGGLGIFDNLAIAVPVDDAQLTRILAGLGVKPPEPLARDPNWGDEFLNLIDGTAESARLDSATHLESKRRPFQPACTPESKIWFDPSSGVNNWTALWLTDGVLGFYFYDQG